MVIGARVITELYVIITKESSKQYRIHPKPYTLEKIVALVYNRYSCYFKNAGLILFENGSPAKRFLCQTLKRDRSGNMLLQKKKLDNEVRALGEFGHKTGAIIYLYLYNKLIPNLIANGGLSSSCNRRHRPSIDSYSYLCLSKTLIPVIYQNVPDG